MGATDGTGGMGDRKGRKGRNGHGGQLLCVDNSTTETICVLFESLVL